MKVVHVSRGKVALEDGLYRFEALSEGLLPGDESLPRYVVYLNGLSEIDADGGRTEAPVGRRAELIECIQAHFAARSTIVEFE